MTNLDGSAGDADYGRIGQSYAAYRQPEPAIEALILNALGEAASILNVGAGSGSYEPRDRKVTALEPSASMRSQRPVHLPAAINGTAESLPFANKSFDASMATFTIHQWLDLETGLAEMRRVTRGPVVLLTCDPAEVQSFWLNDYAPGVLSAEAKRYPSFERLKRGLKGEAEISAIPMPLLCRDGFNEAYYGRPEKLLDADARLSCSAWSFVSNDQSNQYVDLLAADLASGTWDARYGHLRSTPFCHGSLYLITGRP